jgi:hypothetical protein
MKKLIIAGVAAAVVLLGVGIFVGQDLTRSRERAPKPGVEVTGTLPPEPTTPPEPEPDDTTIGATQNYRDPDGYRLKLTVFRYRDYGEVSYVPGRRGVAIEVRATVLAAPAELGPVELGWSPWTLGDKAGHTWEATPGNVEAEPVYPDGRATAIGSSRRGWITFDLPAKARPTFIEYGPGFGATLKWPIP